MVFNTFLKYDCVLPLIFVHKKVVKTRAFCAFFHRGNPSFSRKYSNSSRLALMVGSRNWLSQVSFWPFNPAGQRLKRWPARPSWG